MAIRMLIDASHEEETRVSIVNGNRVEDFDYESSTKKQLKGNIYLAKITRVEPSLQAAFVEYGGNRHGFLAFSEIHPDYYQIPAADKAALVAEEEVAVKKAIAERKARRAAEKESRKAAKIVAKEKAAAKESEDKNVEEKDTPNAESETNAETADKENLDTKTEKSSDDTSKEAKDDKSSDDHKIMSEKTAEPDEIISEKITNADDASSNDETAQSKESDEKTDSDDKEEDDKSSKTRRRRRRRKPVKDESAEAENLDEDEDDEDDDEDDEAALRIQIAKRLRHRYQIQEVMKKRQIILIQVVKEERGNKGAALTTYLSLPGRYCVLMPNTLHGGGVSRKIANVQDRRRLKKIQGGLNMPEGMACIIRTAGKGRTKPDITRDYDYLKRMWEAIRDVTLKSVAPCLIYEEGNLIKRSIRDQYTRDIDEILVEGKKGYESAKEFMEMLMPSHADKVKYYDDKIPLFHRYQVESQLDSMYNPTVQLKSGGYIVINPTEALVSIDVNSGRATKEQNIEKTAQKTNYEAAEEIARQLKLRDMAGLVVIDFIDMEDRANVRSIENRMKECLKTDRARIQVGRISSFGLMEMSRQRLRTGVLESSTHTCPHCEGAGVIRSVESQALHIMRMIEEEGIRNRSAKVTMHLPGSVAIYLLNNKRSDLTEFENRYEISVQIEIDNELSDSSFRMNREDSSQKQETQKPEAQNSLKLGGDVAPTADDVKADSTQNNDAPKRRRRNRKPVQNDTKNSENAEETNEKTDDTNSDSSVDSKEQRPKRRQRRGPRRNRRTAADENTQDSSNENVSSNNNEDNAPAKTETTQKSEPVQKETTNDEKPKPRRRRAAKVNTSEENKSSNETSDEKKTQKPRSRTRKAPEKSDVKTTPKTESKSEEKKTAPQKTVSEKTTAKPLETKTAQVEAPKKAAPKKQGWWQRTFGD